MKKETFAELEIITKNVLHNFKYFKNKLNIKTKLLVLIKANSYGHGAIEFSKIMERAGADYFAVAHPIEGIELRAGGIKKTPIMVLIGETNYYKELIEHRLEPCFPNINSLKNFYKILKGLDIDSYPVHLILDTGMHRLGFMKREIPELLNFLKKHPQIRVKSVFSHLAASDEKKWDKFTLEQITQFQELAHQIEECIGYHPLCHILNSAGIERFTKYQMDMVRLGIGVYGISSIKHSNLKPAAALKCKIIQIKNLGPKDGTIGYGRHGKITKHSQIATIPLGYADGIDRRLGNGKAKFLVKGKLVPTIGNICMDMSMIDITGSGAKVGDTVTIFGEKPTAQSLAKILGTIPYEIITSVNRRIRRVSK